MYYRLRQVAVILTYEKNGFIPNAELYNKNRTTISMRKDIYTS